MENGQTPPRAARLDAVIRTVGIEWDQARITSKSRPLGAELEAEMRAVARRIRKFDDFHREFAAQAKKREALAQSFEAQGRIVAAREAYLAASLLWSTACWPKPHHFVANRFSRCGTRPPSLIIAMRKGGSGLADSVIPWVRLSTMPVAGSTRTRSPGPILCTASQTRTGNPRFSALR
jgi:hypothetical protein